MAIVTAPGPTGELPLFDVCAGQWSLITAEPAPGGTGLDGLGRGLHLLYRFRMTSAGPYVDGPPANPATNVEVEFDCEGVTQWPYAGSVLLTGGEGLWGISAQTNHNDGRRNRSAEGKDSEEVWDADTPEYFYRPRVRSLLTLVDGGSQFFVPAWHTRIGTYDGQAFLTITGAGGALLRGVSDSYPCRPGQQFTNDSPTPIQIWTEFRG